MFNSLGRSDISPDGRYILFTTSEVEFPLSENGQPTTGTFRYDTQTKQFERVSIGVNGEVFEGNYKRGVFLGDSDRVVFTHGFPFIDPNIPNVIQARVVLFMRNLQTGVTTELVEGGIFLLNGGKIVSEDGTKLVFEGVGLLPDDTNVSSPQIYLLDIPSNTVSRVTSKPDGSPVIGLTNHNYSISSDGKFVAFATLFEGLTDNERQVRGYNLYLRDLENGETSLIAQDSVETRPGSNISDVKIEGFPPAVSADGRFLAYAIRKYRSSPSGTGQFPITEIVLLNRTTGQSQVLTERITGINVLVSEYTENEPSLQFTSSGDGLYFISRRPTLKEYRSLFFYDATADTLEDLGETLGLFKPSEVKTFALSHDGSRIVFNDDEILNVDQAANLTDKSYSIGQERVYLTDLNLDALLELTVNGRTQDGRGGEAWAPNDLERDGNFFDVDISADGQRAILTSHFALNDGSVDNVLGGFFTRGFGVEDLFLVTATNPLPVTVTSDLTATELVVAASLSSDGQVAAVSAIDVDSNLDFTQQGDALYLYNTNTFERRVLFQDANFRRALELDHSAQKLAFVVSTDVNLVTQTDTIQILDLANDTLSEITAGFNANSGSDLQLSFTSDGRFLAFSSQASNIVSGDTNGVSDIFLYDTAHSTFQRVSTSSAGEQLNGRSAYPSLSADGRFLVFASEDPNLAPSDSNNTWDIFVKDLTTGAVALVSTTQTGQTPDGASDQGKISGDGTSIAFRSYATDIVRATGSQSIDLFWTQNPLLSP